MCHRKFIGFHYKQIIASPLRGILQQCRLVKFQNSRNITRRFAVSLVVLLPDTIAGHAITCTNKTRTIGLRNPKNHKLVISKEV